MLLNLLNSRKSVVSFNNKAIDKDVLLSLFNSAMFAPSAMNTQPWRYIYASSGEAAFETILSSLADGNKRWAKDAAVLIVSMAQMEYEHNGKIIKNRHAWHDTGMANIQLMLQATELGLATHPMGGFDAEKLRQSFKLPAEFEPIVIIALGYPGDESLLSEDLLERQRKPKTRKPLSEILVQV